MFNLQSILEGIPFLQDTDIEALLTHINIVKLPPATMLIPQGSRIAYEMYILVKGAVSIHRTDNPPKSTPSGLHRYHNGHLIMSEHSDESQVNQYGMPIAIINKPKSVLGEQAILTNRPRAVSVITKDESTFLVIHRNDCEGFLRTYAQQEEQKKSLLTQAFPAILSYTSILQERVFRAFRVFKITRNHVVSKMKDHLYVIQSGEISLNCITNSKFVKQICLLQEGSMFGEEWAFSEELGYKAVCQSAYCQLMFISLKELLNIIPISNLPILEQHFLVKKKLIQKKLQPKNHIESKPMFYINPATAQLKKRVLNIKDDELQETNSSINNWFPPVISRRIKTDYTNKNQRKGQQGLKNYSSFSQRDKLNNNNNTNNTKYRNHTLPNPDEFVFSMNNSGFMPMSRTLRQRNRIYSFIP